MSTVLVLLAAYNGKKYIRDMVDSILAQDYDDFHLILSDDNSSDNTAEILEEYAMSYSDKITHYRSGKRFGNAQNHFMHLLEKFHDAPYIMFCDQDDIWHSDKIRKTLCKMKEIENDSSLPAMVHTDLCVVDGELNVIDDSFMHFSKLDGNRMSLNQLLMQNVVTGCTMMVNSSLASMATNNIPSDGILMHDWWLALVAAAFGQTGFLNEATIDYRQHGNNIVGAKNTRSLSYIYKKLVNNEARESIKRTFDQAEVIHSVFSTDFTVEKSEILRQFSLMRTEGFIKRRIKYIKYGFYKCGLMRIVGQFIWG